MKRCTKNRARGDLSALLGFLLCVACGQAPPPMDKNLYSIPYSAFPFPADNQPSPERIELGRLLFFDPILSINRKVACATCHQPELAMADGLPVGAALADPAGGDLLRATPTIVNARFQHVQFWDGRAKSLEDLALKPIQNPREMGDTVEQALADLGALPEYAERFQSAYGGLDASSLARAIACFVSSVISVSAPVDRYLLGDPSALGSDAIAGFDLYFGKARCSRCHYLPLFAGTEGPVFDQTSFRVTGVPGLGPLPKELTSDPGRAGVAAVETQPSTLHAFKTPTLRNIAKSAPYMHNGAFATLEEVLDFYDQGAGPGQGYAVQNLDNVLKQGPLHLSESEKQSLLVFLREALTDLSMTPATPAAVPSGLVPGGVPRKK
jgi:cytochrome c peroxidase